MSFYSSRRRKLGWRDISVKGSDRWLRYEQLRSPQSGLLVVAYGPIKRAAFKRSNGRVGSRQAKNDLLLQHRDVPFRVKRPIGKQRDYCQRGHSRPQTD